MTTPALVLIDRLSVLRMKRIMQMASTQALIGGVEAMTLLGNADVRPGTMTMVVVGEPLLKKTLFLEWMRTWCVFWVPWEHGSTTFRNPDCAYCVRARTRYRWAPLRALP